jgi:hypothetical protein
MEKTLRIRVNTSIAGTDYTYSAGQEVDAPEYIANDLIRAGHAEIIAAPQVRTAEKATQKAPIEKR